MIGILYQGSADTHQALFLEVSGCYLDYQEMRMVAGVGYEGDHGW
jgi:hypothetical protein